MKGDRKMKYTNTMKINGEIAARSLSEKARDFYVDTDPLNVYEYEDADGMKLYAYDGCFGSAEGLTFEELQRVFEDMQDDLEADYE